MRLIYLGPPGAGKGTMAKMIAKETSYVHVSTGDLFREHMSEKTELGKRAAEYVEKGELVPDDLVVDMVKVRIVKDDLKNGFMLDGFPRTEPQAKSLQSFLDEKGLSIDHVLNFDISDEEVIRRLGGRRICKECGEIFHAVSMPPKVEGVCDACGGEVIQRKDDEEATIRNRLEVYRNQTAPLIKFYEDLGLLRNVPASHGVEEVKSYIEKLIS